MTLGAPALAYLVARTQATVGQTLEATREVHALVNSTSAELRKSNWDLHQQVLTLTAQNATMAEAARGVTLARALATDPPQAGPP